VEAPPPPPATAARVSAAAVGQAAAHSAGDVSVLAKPPVRKLAKELGVDLTTVVGTGDGGVITRADVETASAGTPSVRPAVVLDANRERRIPVKGVRKLMAQAMADSAFTAPHVTEFLTLDMTASMELVQTLRKMPDFADVKVMPLLLVAKALLLAVKRNPEVNSTFTDSEIVVKDYVHLGIAAATPRGLVVPNIKDADQLALPDLARALQQLTDTARAGRTSPADMQNGTITITNVGVFGVDTGTPIINPGESAILAFGAVRPTPWVVDGEVQVRQVTTLALSFDHRHVDGQLGSQFLADLGRVLAEPATALAWS
jgi:pyruvate dehydrogenase E2 component (dihydrolipoamide acetyltransferase)